MAALFASTVCAEAQRSKQQWVKSSMKSMSLREQIAQLFVIACRPQQGEEHVNRVMEIISREQLGGILWSLSAPTQYVHLWNRSQSLVRIPLMVSMDAEWGVSMRLDSVIRFPQHLTLGAIVDDGLIYDFGVEVARQCKEIGVHMNYAPVVDINNNPKNPVINMRSFGENKYKVTEKGYAYMKGMHDGGILTTLKHFPGHGDTDRDSHDELPMISHDIDHLNDIELYPFRELIKRGATGVMTAHLLIPALAPGGIPTSQSKEVCTDLLQKKMKFKGLIVTDGLEMKGAYAHGDTNKVALYALMAGSDILEVPVNMKKSIDEIEQAVKSGVVSKRFIEKKCKKVLAAKYDLGLHKGFTPIDPVGIVKRLNTEHAQALRHKLSEASITLLSNKEVLPLSPATTHYIEIGEGGACKEVFESNGVETLFSTNVSASKERFDLLAAELGAVGTGRTIVVGCHDVPRGRLGLDYGVGSQMVDFLDEIAKTHRVVLVFFGNPYALANFKDLERFSAVVVAYDNSNESQIAAANALLGKQRFLGRLPVTINERFREDFGLER